MVQFGESETKKTETSTSEWYKHGLGLVVAILFLPFFAIWYIWAKSGWNSVTKWSLTAVVAVLFIIIASSGNNSPQQASNSNSTSNTTANTTTTTAPQQSQVKPAYEIVTDGSQNALAKLVVYTPEKDDQKLIAINDELLNKYKANHSNIYFDYFDDKEIAKTYFDKQLDDIVSESEKDAMFTHYVANMKYNLSSGLKTFSKNVNGDWQSIKSY
ncbi:MAG: hypothetical protein WC536_01110 [Patescibacteria group bacterium]